MLDNIGGTCPTESLRYIEANDLLYLFDNIHVYREIHSKREEQRAQNAKLLSYLLRLYIYVFVCSILKLNLVRL